MWSRMVDDLFKSLDIVDKSKWLEDVNLLWLV